MFLEIFFLFLKKKILVWKKNFWNFMKWGLSIDADSGPPRYVLWCCGGICHELLTFFQIGCGHTVYNFSHDFRYNCRHDCIQKYSRLRCLLRVKGLVICFYLGWSGSILQFRQNIIKVGSKSWLLTCSSNITLSLPSYTGSALKRELNFCNGYLSLLYF